MAKYVRPDFIPGIHVITTEDEPYEIQKRKFFTYNKWEGSFKMDLKRYSDGTEYQRFL